MRLRFILALLALIGADICVLALLAFVVLGSLVILTDESLETKPHMVLFQ